MYLWGTKKLKIEPDSYNPPYATRERELITLIPSADITTPNSVIQDGGRDRRRADMSGFCNSLAEYNELYADYLGSVINTFTGPEGETLTGIIYDLSAPKRVMRKKYEYSLTVIEV